MRDQPEIFHPIPPVCDRNARCLILGSMPGEASLAAREYYAHPRNQFWEIMARLLRFERELPYRDRLDCLRYHGVALWDMIASCRRKGSLDANIQKHTVTHHDIVRLLHRCPGIKVIGFNGREAEHQFRRSGIIDQTGWPIAIRMHSLPSTSPAMASMSLDEKLRIWRKFLSNIQGG